MPENQLLIIVEIEIIFIQKFKIQILIINKFNRKTNEKIYEK